MNNGLSSLLKIPTAIALTFLTTACATPQRMPEAVFSLQVVDEDTNNPISGATVQLFYAGVRDSRLAASATTNEDGAVILHAAKMSLPTKFGDAYFAGGYMREFWVKADGYNGGSYTEGPHGFPKGRIILQLSRK